MWKSYVIKLSLVFTVLFITFTVNYTLAVSDSVEWLDELNVIDIQIVLLKNQLHKFREDAEKAEIHAQSFMLDNWHQFAEDIRISEDDEKSIQMIKEEIKNFKFIKQQILRKQLFY